LFANPVAAPVIANVLRPGNQQESFETATADAVAVCDCTASVPVARALAAGNIKARRAISLFLNPSADALVLLAEDEGKKCRLDWLEMQYYREVTKNPALLDHLRTP